MAEKSSHTRGSTVDLTIVALPLKSQAVYIPGQRLVSCTTAASERFQDNSLDFCTGYDCLDIQSHHDTPQIGIVAQYHRNMLRALMEKYGF